MIEELQILTKELKLKHWGDGPWVDEPDYAEWEYRGYFCQVLRNCGLEGHNNEHLFGGNINGYVQIPEGHPWYGKDYDDIEADIHGGLTFGQETPQGFVIGFDTAHSGDIVPSMEKFTADRIAAGDQLYLPTKELRDACPDASVWKQTYRTIEFVKAECESLVDQAIEAAK